MILGRLIKPPPSSVQDHTYPIVVPLMAATIELPRLSVSRTLSFLVDTGADNTCLHYRDAFQVLGFQRYYNFRAPIRESIGVGGSQQYFTETAWILLQHIDGRIETYEFSLGVVVPYWNDLQKLSIQARLPSILGWDILQYFRLVASFADNELYLESSI